MTGKTYPYTVSKARRPTLGIIVLEADETLEAEFRSYIPADVDWYISRIPSAAEVTPKTLATMKSHLGPSAQLFPAGKRFDAVAYACTSGASEIGMDWVAGTIKNAVDTNVVTDPVTALVAACAHLKVRKLGLLSPYIAPVSEKLRNVLADHGIATPVFGSFDIADEATVAKIDAASIEAAASDLMQDADVDALFLSCTNLRTMDVILPLAEKLGKPVLSSNQVLAWDLLRGTGFDLRMPLSPSASI